MSFGGPHLIASMASLLGIRGGMNIAIHNPPEGFMEVLLPLPEGASLLHDAKTGLDLQVVFASKKHDLIAHLTGSTRGMSVMGCVWVAFPTVTETPHQPTEDFVRLAALELGLTDTKKVMLDPAWTALKLQWKPRNPRVDLPSARA